MLNIWYRVSREDTSVHSCKVVPYFATMKIKRYKDALHSLHITRFWFLKNKIFYLMCDYPIANFFTSIFLLYFLRTVLEWTVLCMEHTCGGFQKSASHESLFICRRDAWRLDNSKAVFCARVKLWNYTYIWPSKLMKWHCRRYAAGDIWMKWLGKTSEAVRCQ